MVPRRLRSLDSRGFSLVELVVVVGVIGIIMAVSTPSLLSYWRTSTLRAGAEELSAILNGARQLAIKENTTVCVKRNGSRIRYHTPACGGAAWTGVGTESNGDIRLQNSVTISADTADVIFTYLGAASTPGTYTVRNPVDGRTLSVIVASTGRVRIGP